MQNLAKRTRTLMALALVLSPAMVKAQSDGTLDPSFGSGGIVTTDFAGAGDGAAAIAVQTDGKLVVAGNSFDSSFSTLNFAVARYNSDGTLDAGFGTGGKVKTDVGGRFEAARAVALQGDGKIVVAGGTVNLFNDFALVRYNSNGTLDTSFGTGGKVLTAFGVSAQADSVAVQSDGKIVVGGYANIDGGYNFELVRYNSDGTLDNGFGTGGKLTTDFGLSTQGFSFAQANSLALQKDGKIILAGQAFIGGAYNFALVRYNSNGTLDAGFGTGGRLTTPFATPNNSSNVSAESVAVQQDGKIVAAGLAAFDVALARYTSDGTLDPSFGTGGRVTTSISPSYDQTFSVAVQPDGKIVAAGRTVTLSDGNFHSLLLRYNSNGVLDTAFGAGGNVTNIFGVANEAVSSIAVQPDGKIVAAGGANFNGNSDFALARFNSGNDSNATQQFTKVGNEGDVINVPAGTTVRYGFGSNFSAPITFQAATTFTANNAFFGSDPFPGQVKEVDALGSGAGTTTGIVPPPATQQFTKVANEGDVITVPAGTTVRYGFGSSFTAPITFQAATTFTATNAFFGGDPFPGQVKEVDALGSGAGVQLH